jgi:transcription elongation factor Elf1
MAFAEEPMNQTCQIDRSFHCESCALKKASQCGLLTGQMRGLLD